MSSERMKALGDRLLGTWTVTGGAEGTVRYEYFPGGHFLLQHVELVHDGRPNRSLEIIGHDKPFGGERAEEISSRLYGEDGETLRYVYELDGDELTIWGGEKGSPAYYRGTFSADGSTLAGAWHWPGGGYESVATRLDEKG